MAGVLIVVLLIAAAVGYSIWLRQGVRPRQLTTKLPADQVRALFVDKVARTGWQIVDDGNPMVAQSPLITGTRQQIGMTTRETPGGLHIDIRPLRMRVKVLTRTPTKGHTLRYRLNGFVSAVQAADPALQIAGR